MWSGINQELTRMSFLLASAVAGPDNHFGLRSGLIVEISLQQYVVDVRRFAYCYRYS